MGIKDKPQKNQGPPHLMEGEREPMSLGLREFGLHLDPAPQWWSQ